MPRLLTFCFLAMIFGGTGALYFRRICEGKSLTINCGARVIDILSASYGRTQQGLCGRKGNTNCRAGTSMRVARFECQQQHRCVLYAKNSAFGDPCKGTAKYLQVTYQCVYTTRPEVLLRICEGLSRTVRCYRGKKINIIEANYGRLTGGQICPGPIKTTYCGAARSQAKVRTACQGKPQCVLQAKNNIYGDPCRGTKKYLEVGIIQFKLFLLDCIFLLLSISLHML
ncbi:rhamnose-binding lectin-like isoform X2 [Orbicella faveolata]|uniref:rhamnose-binding lectin-like isoform X2 n=1 Tax=Orbicella faveolata TaxID=48498 RepID=UPI0009E22E53|nr:rhamnose-binding lectin-like isoform X2 [Orbicella faveolata]